jgi:pimeloyl-ACP methyl ester carboxylesterase
MAALAAVSAGVWHACAPQGAEAEMRAMPDTVFAWRSEGQYVPAPRVAGDEGLPDGSRREIFVRHGVVKDSGETVVLVPDLRVSSIAYRSTVGALIARGITAIAFDPLGVGLSDAAHGGAAALDDEGVAAAIKAIYGRLQLRAAHLVLQGDSARGGLLFAERNRPRVRSLTFTGVNPRTGHASGAAPALLGGSVGARRLLAMPLGSVVLSLWCAAWGGGSACSSESLAAHIYLTGHRKDPAELAAAAASKAAERAACGAGCASEFGTRLASLSLNFSFVGCRTSQCCRRQSHGPHHPLDTRAAAAVPLANAMAPSELAPDAFADAVTSFVFEQDPTPSKPEEPLPEHIKAQLAAGGGHSHGHGGHDHGHGGHDHGHAHGHMPGSGGGGHGFSGGNYGL